MIITMVGLKFNKKKVCDREADGGFFKNVKEWRQVWV